MAIAALIVPAWQITRTGAFKAIFDISTIIGLTLSQTSLKLSPLGGEKFARSSLPRSPRSGNSENNLPSQSPKSCSQSLLSFFGNLVAGQISSNVCKHRLAGLVYIFSILEKYFFRDFLENSLPYLINYIIWRDFNFLLFG